MHDMDTLKKNTGITRLIKACNYSRDGLIATFKSEAAFRQEVAMAAVLIPLALFISPDPYSTALMIGSVILVLIVELMNTAIEVLVERISPEIHPLSKKAKDIGSAAVLLSLVNLGLMWFFALV